MSSDVQKNVQEGLEVNSGQKFIVYALWLKGHTMPMIAHWLGVGTKQVAGVIARSQWPNRSKMSDGERQEALSELSQIRMDKNGVPLDGGVLNRFVWKIEPLEKVQQRG